MDPAVTPSVRVYPDLRSASRALARYVVASARSAVADHDRFRWVISGGSTPIALYRMLAGAAGRAVPWSAVEVFFADERCVPFSSPESNFGLARQALFSGIPLARRRVHAIRTAGRSPARAAREYEALLRRTAALSDGVRPAFDLVLLGIGPDGHTASLFPGATALRDRRHLATTEERPGRPPFVPRVTMTLPALADSRAVCFLVSGHDKAPALRSILGRRKGRGADLPAARVRSQGTVTWFVDRAAARTR